MSGALIAVLMVIISSGKTEPKYKGKSLREWKNIYQIEFNSDDPGEEREVAMSRQAVQAAHEMRADIIPIALNDIQCESPAWPRHFAEKIGQSDFLFRWCPYSVWKFLHEDRAEDGMIYFRMLGPDGGPAVPDLTSIMNQTKSIQVRDQAIFSLGYIGGEGLKPLMEALMNPRFPSHERVIYAIGDAIDNGADASLVVPLLLNKLTNSDDAIFKAAIKILGRPTLAAQNVLPALIDCLQSTNQVRRGSAVLALGEFGGKAQSAVPYLIKALSDSDESVRFWATDALKKISPDILGTNISTVH